MPSRAPAKIDTRRQPVLGYPSQLAACLALRDAGDTFEEIGAKIGRDSTHVRAALRGAAVKRPRTFTVPMRLLDCFENEARARGIGRVELAQQVLELIAREDLFEALLGEAEGSDA